MPLTMQTLSAMGSERPYPGQLWKRDSRPVMVVAVSPTTVTYDDLDRKDPRRNNRFNFAVCPKPYHGLISLLPWELTASVADLETAAVNSPQILSLSLQLREVCKRRA